MKNIYAKSIFRMEFHHYTLMVPLALAIPNKAIYSYLFPSCKVIFSVILIRFAWVPK